MSVAFYKIICSTDRNVCACQIQAAAELTMAADAAIVSAVALGRRDRHTQPNKRNERSTQPNERNQANETEGNGQSRKQKQVAKAAAKFGAAR